ncbi:YrzE family protein [Carboxylicivirga marina]|uniref:YrzE family protein n=1 Tax=Carboxylicivirga marina TaxID=2800988 RepID=UPI002592637F|nr:YrzE family protein [uncultured Carboxylicivirga sp.]
MKELSKKQEEFYSKWEERRKNKWQYAFLHGSVYWGIPIAIVSFLLNSDFQIENMQISRLIISLILFGIGGLIIGLWQFKTVDSVYKGLDDSDVINEGIQKLHQGQTWDYENLKICQDKGNSLIVRNDLLWYDKEINSIEKNDEFLEQIISDFRRLQKNSKFKDFSKSKEVKIQLYDNDSDEKLLLEKTIK